MFITYFIQAALIDFQVIINFVVYTNVGIASFITIITKENIWHTLNVYTHYRHSVPIIFIRSIEKH